MKNFQVVQDGAAVAEPADVGDVCTVLPPEGHSPVLPAGKEVPYDKLIDTSYAEVAIKKYPGK